MSRCFRFYVTVIESDGQAMALLTVQYGDTIIENGNAYEADGALWPPSDGQR